jgi:hypothetical protein
LLWGMGVERAEGVGRGAILLFVRVWRASVTV